MSSRSAKGRRSLRLVPDLERANHAVSLYLQANTQLGCTQAEANVLAFLYDRGGSSLADVHASFGHRRSTLTSVIDRLEDRKLVLRERDEKDRRAFTLSLTRAGSRIARAAAEHLGRLEAQTAARVSARDLQAFVRVADALVDSTRDAD